MTGMTIGILAFLSLTVGAIIGAVTVAGAHSPPQPEEWKPSALTPPPRKYPRWEGNVYHLGRRK